MGAKTKIDWCDATWNPVTGCLHGCEYCYARRIAERFGGFGFSTNTEISKELAEGKIVYVPAALVHYRSDKNYEVTKAPYPFGFKPTFYRERLDIPKSWTRPRNIFVCSMADLFGEWVPDEWIKAVLDACREAPQHRYLFLTKNPARYDELEEKDLITDKDQNFWLGSTVTVETRDLLHYTQDLHTFQSCEPMLAPWPPAGAPNFFHLIRGELPEWVIFGAETGNRKGKIVPEKSWLDNAVQMCRNMGAKVFMKESLRDIMGPDFVQEFPWEGEP